jgi:hypothetical protein
VTPNELYALKPVEILRDDLGPLKGSAGAYDHLPEVSARVDELAGIARGPLAGRFDLRFYARRSIDERRVWWLYALYLDGAPVMILQNAGREGDDFYRRIVTHPDRLASVVTFLRAHLPVGEFEAVDPTKPVKGLDAFYGDHLSEHLKRL